MFAWFAYINISMICQQVQGQQISSAVSAALTVKCFCVFQAIHCTKDLGWWTGQGQRSAGCHWIWGICFTLSYANINTLNRGSFALSSCRSNWDFWKKTTTQKSKPVILGQMEPLSNTEYSTIVPSPILNRVLPLTLSDSVPSGTW